jgi:hypothetical protein
MTMVTFLPSSVETCEGGHGLCHGHSPFPPRTRRPDHLPSRRYAMTTFHSSLLRRNMTVAQAQAQSQAKAQAQAPAQAQAQAYDWAFA